MRRGSQKRTLHLRVEHDLLRSCCIHHLQGNPMMKDGALQYDPSSFLSRGAELHDTNWLTDQFVSLEGARPSSGRTII